MAAVIWVTSLIPTWGGDTTSGRVGMTARTAQRSTSSTTFRFFRSSQSRLVKTALGGWQVSGIVTLSSGLPINIGLSGNQSGNGLPAASNRPNLTGSVSYPHTVAQWFDKTAFTAPAVGAFGTLGHNALRGPGRDNWNLSLFKSFLLSEARGSRLEFRAESFNTWNHTQFHDVSTNLGDNKFGQVTSAFEPRIFQLGMKIVF